MISASMAAERGVDKGLEFSPRFNLWLAIR
jgi:hypothetical protein